jgi:hypothetical protein
VRAQAKGRRFWIRLAVAVAVGGTVYVGLRLSPSSYGFVLGQLGAADVGVLAGQPRVERGDEFGWQTPLLQMTIRSGFRRFDRTPPYFEDLRTLYAMPIKDWALVFKPQFWLFFVAPPATAYSFYQFLLIALFVVGFTALFVHLGGRQFESLLMALVVYSASYTQYWWDGSANFLWPVFPWIVLAPLWDARLAFRLLLFYWLLVCGLLMYFYPPNAIIAGFLAIVLWSAISPGLLRWRNLLALGLTAGAAAATVYVYLREPIARVAQTVYPGQRIAGGGGVSFRFWVTQFLPTSQMNHHVALAPTPNICELSTIGSIYVLAVVFCAPWRTIIKESTREERRRWGWIGAGLLMTQAWMVLPLPPWVGFPLLWHLVPPGRMVFGGGLLLVVLAFLVGQSRPLVLTPVRATLFCLVLVAGWAMYKRPYGIGLLEAYRDWGFVVPVTALAVVQLGRAIRPHLINTTLLGAAAVLGVISFGTFNPIQSTTPIFETPHTALTSELDRRLREEGRGYLLLPWGTSFFSQTGLPLVGLGYPSLAYSTFDPAMDLWSRVYPEVPAERLRRTLDNVGSIGFGDVAEPEWIPIITKAPMAPFLRPGATVCDFIRPSRAAFAPSVGCPVATSSGQ